MDVKLGGCCVLPVILPTVAAGQDAIDPDTLARHSGWFRDAAAAGITVNTARRTSAGKKRRAWRPGCATGQMTTCGSPMNCAFLR